MKPELVLRDIHLPAEPGWWPPAPGWWLLALLLLVLLGWLLRVVMRWRRARRRRAALAAEFAAAAAVPQAVARLAAISALLRRAARTRDPASVSLKGEDWLRFLDQQLGADPVFLSGPGRLLLHGPYQPVIEESAIEALLPAARRCFNRLLEQP